MCSRCGSTRRQWRGGSTVTFTMAARPHSPTRTRRWPSYSSTPSGGFALPPSNDIDVYAQDLGFIAIGGPDGLEGFNVVIGGGMGRTDQAPETYPRLASLIGFVPADAPRLVILVLIDEPKKSYWGGEVAAPVFQKIARKTLRYLHVPSSLDRVFVLDRV